MSLCYDCEHAVFVTGLEQPYSCFVLGEAFTQDNPQPEDECSCYAQGQPIGKGEVTLGSPL